MGRLDDLLREAQGLAGGEDRLWDAWCAETLARKRTPPRAAGEIAARVGGWEEGLASADAPILHRRRAAIRSAAVLAVLARGPDRREATDLLAMAVGFLRPTRKRRAGPGSGRGSRS